MNILQVHIKSSNNNNKSCTKHKFYMYLKNADKSKQENAERTWTRSTIAN